MPVNLNKSILCDIGERTDASIDLCIDISFNFLGEIILFIRK
jgi:hypothetical protein